MKRLIPLLALLMVGLTACGFSTTSGEAEGGELPTSEDLDDGGAAGTCPEGTEDCNDTPMTSGMCVEDEPDCEDMVVEEDGSAADEGGHASGTCLAGDDECSDTVSSDGAQPLVSADIAIVDEFGGELTPMDGGREELTNIQPILAAEAVVDGASLTLAFTVRNLECVGLDHIETVEEDDRVIVTIYVGERPDAGDCEDDFAGVSATVELEEPLGDRALLDGTRVAPEDAQS